MVSMVSETVETPLTMLTMHPSNPSVERVSKSLVLLRMVCMVFSGQVPQKSYVRFSIVASLKIHEGIEISRKGRKARPIDACAYDHAQENRIFVRTYEFPRVGGEKTMQTMRGTAKYRYNPYGATSTGRMVMSKYNHANRDHNHANHA